MQFAGRQLLLSICERTLLLRAFNVALRNFAVSYSVAKAVGATSSEPRCVYVTV